MMLIYFYDSLDKRLFNEHNNKKIEYWCTNRKWSSMGKKYTGQQLLELDQEMPDAIYLLVDPFTL